MVHHGNACADPWGQMIEELVMAVLMSIAFALPVFYICELHGSFLLVWLVWLVSLADGIGALSALRASAQRGVMCLGSEGLIAFCLPCVCSTLMCSSCSNLSILIIHAVQTHSRC